MPSANGQVERFYRTLMDNVRRSDREVNLPIDIWTQTIKFKYMRQTYIFLISVNPYYYYLIMLQKNHYMPQAHKTNHIRSFRLQPGYLGLLLSWKSRLRNN